MHEGRPISCVGLVLQREGERQCGGVGGRLVR